MASSRCSWAMGPSVRATLVVVSLGALTVLYHIASVGQTGPPDFFQVRKISGGEYLVSSPSCRIPDMPARHPSIKGLLKSVGPIVCSRRPPPSYVERLSTGAHVLRLEDKAAHCCYHNVTRPADLDIVKTPDELYNLSECKPIENGEARLLPEEEFLLVKCGKVMVNAHVVVAETEAVRRRVEAQQEQAAPGLSVLLLGIDSMSRLSLFRTMPHTVELLQRRGWVEYKGYNKVGDNTFPNLIALLTGLSYEKVKKVCCKTKETPMDDIPLIWKDFHQQGYITAYAEDEVFISTFNYQKGGFKHQPTDYYLRPFFLATNKKLKSKSTDQSATCAGSLSVSEHILRYAVDFATVFQNASYFALFWVNNFSHDNLNTPSAMDIKIMYLLQELTDSGVLNNTLVLFFSDHGMRFGKIRETVVGWFEDRLPFLYFWIPPWFRSNYPDAYKNIVTNSNRLTSPFDVHATLRDVLERAGRTDSEMSVKNASLECPTCNSLFREIPYDRKCKDAGIQPHWCACTEYRTVSTKDTTMQACAKYALSELQSMLDAANKERKVKLCADLKLKRVVEGKSNDLDIKAETDHVDYVVVFQTTPGDGLFEATVRHFHKDPASFSLTGQISRLNIYANQSRCISDAHLKLYCYCLDKKV
ncbi:uncharacterized protein LOC124617960 isoform X1 [Schistocerca americana]|uniref:uncharacterized protein LOC124617960 isoform X1 n=4 Tax=Schistocerca americana TaxID=7009 RepID=UPI001F4F64FC|nr:uncharacterized protein LOC124617960 isoform X1 [Schistocerca americana]